MLILPRYILRQHIGPFLFGNLVIIFIFLTNWLLQNIYKFVGKGLTFGVIIEVILLNLAWITTLSVPMSVLLSTLTAFGKLSQEHEITAIRSSGVSTLRMLTVPFVASIILMAGMVQFNNDVLPWANHRLKNLMSDVYKKKPALNFQNGVFTNQIPNYHLLIKHIDPNSPRIYGITIFDYSDPTIKRVIVADHGSFEFAPHTDRLLLTLYLGEIHDLQRANPEDYQRLVFERHLVSIPMEGLSFRRTRSDRYSDREMSIGAMRQRIAEVSKEVRDRKANIKTYLRMDNLALTDQRLLPFVQNTADSLQRTLAGIEPGLTQAIARSNQSAMDSLRAAMTRTSNIKEHVSRELAVIRSRLTYIDQLKLEIQKKFSIPAACIVFVLIGVPLGMLTQRGGLAVAGGISLFFFVLYWALIIAGEDLSDRGFLNPYVAAWMPNFIIGLGGIGLTIRVIAEQPFGWKGLQRLIDAVRKS